MKKSSFHLLLVLTSVSFLVVVAWAIEHLWSHHQVRSLDQSFHSKSKDEIMPAFRDAGTEALPLLAQKLTGHFPDPDRAIVVIGNTFKGSQIENTSIATNLRALMLHGSQAQQVSAYVTIRKLGLKVPDSEYALAASTNPSIRADEEERVSTPKLERLYGMKNQPVDCGVLIGLINDSDPQIQFQALGFLFGLHDRKADANLCDGELTDALGSLLNTSTNGSVLMSALGYLSRVPKIMNANSQAICHVLDTSSQDEGLQMECLALLMTINREHLLSAAARQTIGLDLARSDWKPDIRRWVNTGLAETEK